MKTLIALGVAAVGGVLAFRYLGGDLRGRLTSVVRRRMSEHMGQMMEGLPEGSPPKLVMSVLPKLQAQNDQIIALLQEQNKLLKEQPHTSAAGAGA